MELKGLVHNVLFWLKEPNNQESRIKFDTEIKEFLEASENLSSYHIGVPAPTADRPVVDKSYTYCLVVSFDSMEAHDKYQIEPKHIQFLDECKDLWEKVIVYDSQSI